MLETEQPADISRAARNHAWVCLLLSVLFLYNPFLAMQGSSGALSVGHRPSYRATVASSELLKFEKTESRETMAIADVNLFQAFILLQPQLQSSARHDNTEDLHPADHFLSGNLWFRPPPAA
jgi:hypothetical protein